MGNPEGVAIIKHCYTQPRMTWFNLIAGKISLYNVKRFHNENLPLEDAIYDGLTNSNVCVCVCVYIYIYIYIYIIPKK